MYSVNNSNTDTHKFATGTIKVLEAEMVDLEGIFFLCSLLNTEVLYSLFSSSVLSIWDVQSHAHALTYNKNVPDDVKLTK